MCPESRAAAGEEGQGNFAKIAASVCGHTRILVLSTEDGNVSHESKEQKRIQLVGWLLASGGRSRHRLPRIAGELSSVIAGTSPTASFSKSKPIGVSREAFISLFFVYI